MTRLAPFEAEGANGRAPPNPRQRDELLWLALPVLAKLILSAALVFFGFVALSDDDYARVVISQRFSVAPSWDPSGTSWLPFPFWLQGLILRIFSPTFELCRWTSSTLSALALAPLYVAARSTGWSRKQACFGVLLAGMLPYSALLGASTPPEAATGALMATAMLALSGRTQLSLLWLGGVALLIATLSRYESWPVAVVFACLTLFHAIRARKSAWALPGLLALLGPVGWMFHGAQQHGDALFFVARVAHYQQALGVSASSNWLRFPSALARFEPELSLTLMALFLIARIRRIKLTAMSASTWLAAVGLMVFLVWSDVRTSTATHHAERTLISLWMLMALLLARSLGELWRRMLPKDWAALAGVCALGVLCRLEWATLDALAPRDAERDIGSRAGAFVPLGERLAVLTSDYGYFAILSAWARPGTTQVVDDHDPRRKAPAIPALGGTHWLIVERSELAAPRVAACGPQVILENSTFALARLVSPRNLGCLQ